MGNLETRFTLYTTVSGTTQDSQKLVLLLHIGRTKVKEIYRTMKGSQDKYDDVVNKLDAHFTTKKTCDMNAIVLKYVSKTLTRIAQLIQLV